MVSGLNDSSSTRARRRPSPRRRTAPRERSPSSSCPTERLPAERCSRSTPATLRPRGETAGSRRLGGRRRALVRRPPSARRPAGTRCSRRVDLVLTSGASGDTPVAIASGFRRSRARKRSACPTSRPSGSTGSARARSSARSGGPACATCSTSASGAGCAAASTRGPTRQRLQAALAEAELGYRHLPELAPTTELRQLQYAEDEPAGVGKRSREVLAAAYREGYMREILDRADLAADARRAAGGRPRRAPVRGGRPAGLPPLADRRPPRGRARRRGRPPAAALRRDAARGPTPAGRRARRGSRRRRSAGSAGPTCRPAASARWRPGRSRTRSAPGPARARPASRRRRGSSASRRPGRRPSRSGRAGRCRRTTSTTPASTSTPLRVWAPMGCPSTSFRPIVRCMPVSASAHARCTSNSIGSPSTNRSRQMPSMPQARTVVISAADVRRAGPGAGCRAVARGQPAVVRAEDLLRRALRHDLAVLQQDGAVADALHRGRRRARRRRSCRPRAGSPRCGRSTSAGTPRRRPRGSRPAAARRGSRASRRRSRGA